MCICFRWFVLFFLFHHFGFSMPCTIAGRLNKPQIQEEESVPDPKPKPLSSAYWSAEGFASADTVTASIGYSMLKYGTIFGISAAVIVLIFSQGDEQDNGGGGNGHQHTHQHSHQ